MSRSWGEGSEPLSKGKETEEVDQGLDCSSSLASCPKVEGKLETIRTQETDESDTYVESDSINFIRKSRKH